MVKGFVHLERVLVFDRKFLAAISIFLLSPSHKVLFDNIFNQTIPWLKFDHSPRFFYRSPQMGTKKWLARKKDKLIDHFLQAVSQRERDFLGV